MDKSELPTFLELAANRLAWANRGDKTINIKIAINTARMMAVAEAAERDWLRKVNGELVDALSIALPYVETAEDDPGYKAGAVKKVTKKIRAALAKAKEK